MNKNILFFLCFSLLLGCKESSEVESNNQSSDPTTSAIFTVKQGWNIYSGGKYRYGPSIIQNEDNSIDVWFAANGDSFGKKILHYNEKSESIPVRLESTFSAAQKFNATESIYGIAVRCPNWQTTHSSLTISLYLWEGDYLTSINTIPLQSERYENYEDNQYITLKKEDKFSEGEYLWVLHNPAGNAGVWKKEGEISGILNFLNGEIVSGSFEAYQMLEKSSGKVFWDQIAYRKSTDGGYTWTPDVMVLKPTENTKDELAACDPGVVKFGNYYYLGYTSTEDSRGLYNHVYVARATSPTGPWLKWNGSGWGYTPQPVIEFTGEKDAWGAGEPSMVINHDTLFFYYTWNDLSCNETRVATVNIKEHETDWPNHLIYQGIAINKTLIVGADHCDVKYREDLKCYHAIHTASRLTTESYIILWESINGISFVKKSEIRENLNPYLHNCGWSGDEKGHMDPAKPQYLCYAYGPIWGNWKTAWHPISFGQ